MRHIILLLLTLLLASTSFIRAAEPTKRPLNLLFIITDQQRWDAMSCAGNAVLKTPNLDKLARDGARFTSFYSSCPARSLDALYDLQGDPHELTNLIGHNPDREKHRAEAERMKSLLLAWLERTKSQQLEAVKARPVIAN